MKESNQFVVFKLDEKQYALHPFAVERVVAAVEITQLPKAPEIVHGVINIQGRVIPVINIRKRFRLPEHEIDLNDRLIIAKTTRRTVALVVDAVIGIVKRSEQEFIMADKVIPGTDYIEGLIKLEGGIILIPDLDKFLSLEEEVKLDVAVKKRKQHNRK